MTKKKAIALIVAVVVVLAAGIGIYQLSKPSNAQASQLTAVVHCEGWNENTSTPIVVSVFPGDVRDVLMNSTEGEVAVPTPVQTLEAKAGQDVVFDQVTESGKYTICIIGSPVFEDGSIFNVPEPQVVDFDSNSATVQAVAFELEKKDAADVTEADLAAATAAAAKVGADMDKLNKNVESSRNEASSAQGGNIKQGTTNAVVSAPTANNSSNNNSGSSSNNNTSAAQPCSHNWTPITKVVHHDAVYKTVNHPAVTKSVVFCNACGAQDPGYDHMKQHALNGEPSNTHVETVVVTPAYSEQVLVSAAYDETVTTGYRCSSCGATK